MKRPLQYAQEKLTRLNQEVLSPIEEKRRTQLAGRIAYQDVVNFLTNKLNELIWNAVQLESLERVQTLHECGAPLNWCAPERPLGKQDCDVLVVICLFMLLYFVVRLNSIKYVFMPHFLLVFKWNGVSDRDFLPCSYVFLIPSVLYAFCMVFHGLANTVKSFVFQVDICIGNFKISKYLLDFETKTNADVFYRNICYQSLKAHLWFTYMQISNCDSKSPVIFMKPIKNRPTVV